MCDSPPGLSLLERLMNRKPYQDLDSRFVTKLLQNYRYMADCAFLQNLICNFEFFFLSAFALQIVRKRIYLFFFYGLFLYKYFAFCLKSPLQFCSKHLFYYASNITVISCTVLIILKSWTSLFCCLCYS